MIPKLCTTPWTNLFLQWERVTVCCNLLGSVYVPTQPWEAWDDLAGVLDHHRILANHRTEMRQGTAKCLGVNHACRSCETNPTVDTTSEPQWRTVSISATAICGGRCIYCPLWQPSRQPNPPEPSLAQIDNLGVSLSRYPIEQLWFTGGNLLAMSDPAISQYLTLVPGVDIQVVTNGLGLTESRWLEFFQNPRIKLRITLDTLDPEVYRKLRGPFGAEMVHTRLGRLLDQYGGASRVGVGATINTSNLTSVPDLIRFAGEHDIKRVWLNPVDYGKRRTPEACFASYNLDPLRVGELLVMVDNWELLGHQYGVNFGSDLTRIRGILQRALK